MRPAAHAITLRYEVRHGDGPERRQADVRTTVIAGWTGRDLPAMQHHIEELAALGVARPHRTPLFYRVSCSRLTQAPSIEVQGSNASGEVEFVLLQDDTELLVGVGSDHTDRTVETYDVAVSKQMCDKPLASEFWRWADVAAHWDDLVLRSWLDDGGHRELYQDGPVAALLSPPDLVERFTGGGSSLNEGTVMFGGTLPAIGGVRPSPLFEMELFDPVLRRALRHRYRCERLPGA